MRSCRITCVCLLGLVLTACEIEQELAAANPYRTAKIVLLLEQRQIEHRVGKDGKIYYPGSLQEKVEKARKDALVAQRGKFAVLVKRSQAKLLARQFDGAGVNYASKELDHFVLFSWALPPRQQSTLPEKPEEIEDGSVEIVF